jgi:hypothetical protein
MALRVRGESFALRVSEELLRRAVPPETRLGRPAGVAGGKPADAPAELILMLRRELDIKNQQITQQGELLARHIELVNGLSERLREGNILVASLQQRLALTGGRAEAREDAGPKPVESAPRKASAAKPIKARHRSVFARLFR